MTPYSNSPAPRAARRGIAAWLALGLALAYLAVMAMLMWLFESALALDQLTRLVEDPRRLNLWLLIVLSAALVFVVTRWALAHISRGADALLPPGAAAAPRRPRAAGLLLAALGLLLAITGAFVMRAQEELIAEAQFRQIGAVAAAKAEFVAHWVDERRRDLASLMTNSDFRASAAALVAPRPGLARPTRLPALAHWPMNAPSGQILLGRFEGRDVLVLNAPRGEPGRFGFQRLEGARGSWEAALKATAQGQVHEREMADGALWLRAALPVAASPWLLVARMDAEEADRLQGHAQRRVAVAGGFAFVFAMAVAMVGWARGHARAAAFDDERHAMIEQLEALAHVDSLTGLPSRHLTEDRLQVAMALARRDSTGLGLGLLFIDLDGFKAINDHHGHAAGDAMLAVVARRLSQRLRDGDTVGRIGGDEFLVALPRCADAQSLARLGEHFAEAASATMDWHGLQLTVRASVGGALYPAAGADALALTAAADAAMYRAKQAGGGYAAA